MPLTLARRAWHLGRMVRPAEVFRTQSGNGTAEPRQDVVFAIKRLFTLLPDKPYRTFPERKLPPRAKWKTLSRGRFESGVACKTRSPTCWRSTLVLPWATSGALWSG